MEGAHRAAGGSAGQPEQTDARDDRQLAEPPQGPKWAAPARAHLRKVIECQIPTFRARPYIQDEAHLLEQLAGGLPTTLRDEFCWSLCFHPAFIRRLCYEGFLPICSEIANGTGLFVLLPKLHTRRCVLEFSQLRVPKSTRKRVRGFRMSVNRAFSAVMAGCVQQHGEDWLHPPMRAALASLFEWERARGGVAYGARGGHERGSAGSAMASFELWDEAGALVAGEVGCVSGRCYTSFTGFHSVANAGSVQLALTARLLERAGFAFWDLGQEFEYKAQLGARLWPRLQFLERFRAVRSQPSELWRVAAEEELLADPALLLRQGAAERAADGPLEALDAGLRAREAISSGS